MATETIILRVRGMECEACAGHVARALRDVPGVESAEVDLAAEEARVVHDSDLASINDLRHAVQEEGYDA